MDADFRFYSKDQSDTDIKSLSDLIHAPLTEKIYFSASCFPFQSLKDTRTGSCFENWAVYNSCQRPGTKSLTLAHYVDQLDQLLQQQIQEIYSKHSTVTLSFSGGVDALTLLSYIESQGLLNRTVIYWHENRTIDDATSLHVDINKHRALVVMLDRLKSQVQDIVFNTITVDDLIHIINTQDYNHLKCYTTAVAVQYFHNTALIYGHHGNQVLLHKDIFLDQIRINSSDPVINQRIVDCIAQRDFYTQSLQKYNVESQPVPLDYVELIIKPWCLLSGINNNVIYSPLEVGLPLVKDIDYTAVDPAVIFHATAARQLIAKNVGSAYDDFVTTESLADGDNLSQIMLPYDQISRSLTIPSNINHHPVGLEFLNYELQQAQKKNSIHLNTVVTIKMLQYLSTVAHKQ